MNPPTDVPLTYQNFLALLKIQSTLRRSLHLSAGREKRIRAQAIRTISLRLQASPDYEEFLHRVLRSGVLVG
ncbi:MAG: hypothetical protein HY720_17945 [Planctomycetes bacterium]|nr:hypothetical protein [Planctomycetota bacterium]